MAGTLDRAVLLAAARKWRDENAALAAENEKLRAQAEDMRAALEVMEVNSDGD